MAAQNADQPLGELLIYMRMRNETSVGTWARHVGLRPG